MSQDIKERLESLLNIDISDEKIKELVIKFGNIIDGEKIAEALDITGVKKSKVLRAFNNLEQPLVYALLESWAMLCRIKKETTYNQPLLCLTGISPEGYSRNVTDTYQTFSRIVEESKKSITIMGYRINSGNSSFIDILDKKMANDHVEVKILTDHVKTKMEDIENRFLLKWLSNSKIRFRLFSYEHPDAMEKMHIKCLVIDYETIYIGSSNFSFGGVKRNIELGIVIKDKELGATIENIFYVLVKQPRNSNYIEPISYSNLRKKI